MYDECEKVPDASVPGKMEAERMRHNKHMTNMTPVGAAIGGRSTTSGQFAGDSLHGLPSRYQLHERLNKLREEMALVEACLAQWTDETDGQLRFVHNLRQLGYRV